MSQTFPGAYVANTWDAVTIDNIGTGISTSDLYLGTGGAAAGSGTFLVNGEYPTILLNCSGNVTCSIVSGTEFSTRDLVFGYYTGTNATSVSGAVYSKITVTGLSGQLFTANSQGAASSGSLTVIASGSAIHLHNFNGVNWAQV